MSSIAGFFFFQAEDGIRDLVRSRGLGDVYKRQGAGAVVRAPGHRCQVVPRTRPVPGARPGCTRPGPVSYTHLTLPTSDLV